jgi:hypothetical protein
LVVEIFVCIFACELLEYQPMNENEERRMKPNKILIIGVGSAGVIAADKMDLPNSKKLFIDSSYQTLNEVKSEGEKIGLACSARSKCPSFYCHCFNKPDFCRAIVAEYEDEIENLLRTHYFNIRKQNGKRK